MIAWVVGLMVPIEPESMNQRLPLGPAVMAEGDKNGVGRGYSVMAPVVGLIVPIALPTCSVNQRFPSEPAVISTSQELAVGTGYSVMAPVVGLIVPIWLAAFSVNQRLPSGPG